MERERLEGRLFWYMLAVWALSFLVPLDSRLTGFGFSLALLSYFSMVLCVGGAGSELRESLYLCFYGMLWLANVPMLVAPFVFHRAQKGRAGRGFFAGLLTVFAILAISSPLLSLFGLGEPLALSIASWVWAASLVGMSALFLWIAFSRRATAR